MALSDAINFTVPSFKVGLYLCPHEKCRKEGYTGMPIRRFEWDAYEGMRVCPVCGVPPERVGERPCVYTSVALYEVSRAYGGPEEGGWYYDAGHRLDATLRNFDRGDEPVAAAYIQLLEMRAKQMNDERDRYSEVRWVVRFTYDEMTHAAFPLHRPVYS